MKKNKINFFNLIQFTEIIVGGGAALYLFAFDDGTLKFQIPAAITIIVATFFGTSRLLIAHIIKEHIDNVQGDIDRHINTMQETITEKIKEESTLSKFHQIDEVFRTQKRRIIKDIDRLHQKKESTMYMGEYYQWITDAMEKTKEGDEIWAISRMEKIEWEDSEEERKFFQQNIAATKRGVVIKRIFVTTKEVIDGCLAQESPKDEEKINAGRALRAHAKDSDFGCLQGMFADVEKVKDKDSYLLRDIKDGFLMFIYKDGKKVVLLDDFTEDNQARGRIHIDSQVISDAEEWFKQLKGLSGDLKDMH